jgi:hypothetical protein
MFHKMFNTGVLTMRLRPSLVINDTVSAAQSSSVQCKQAQSKHRERVSRFVRFVSELQEIKANTAQF